MAKIVLVLISLFVCQIYLTVDAELKHAKTRCVDKDLNYTVGSSYEKNLNFVFNKLITSSSNIWFYNYTTDDALDDQVYGLYQCRYDLTNRICSECVKDATGTIIKDCPSAGEAIIYYDECMLRYSNRDIFSLPEILQSYYTQSSLKVSNYTEFEPILASEMERLIKNASSTLPHFASGQANLTSDKLYTFAQCTADLDTSDCKDCLKKALSELPTCCNASTGAWAFLPSCLLWYDKTPFLKEMSSLPPPSPPPGLDKGSGTSKTKSLNPGIIAAIGGSISVGLLFLLVVIGICFCRKGSKESSSDEAPRSPFHDEKSEVDGLGDTEFERYKFKTLKIATRDFADENMLGEGGFGIVYKGTHRNGQTLAIKRLSSGTAGQGKKEFMTEARLLAKLQHRNLVKLLGFCSERDEKLLVYEFMPNSSLDVFLFDPTKRPLLDWVTRSKIITGIAKGLQYLHEDSRLTIIHRDLKPANILLDMYMIPKIADFGLAKLSESEGKFGSTHRIAGTRGYMAPEYLMTGDYSNKTDVYSFGIMLLEIVCGRKNRMNSQTQPEDLSIQAWRLWNEERSIEIIDPILLENCPNNEVIRCIQIGLLCVQANAEKRPTMTEVVLMLTCSIDLQIPIPSTPIMTSNQTSMSNSSGQQSDVDRSSTKSTSIIADITHESYSIPR